MQLKFQHIRWVFCAKLRRRIRRVEQRLWALSAVHHVRRWLLQWVDTVAGRFWW